VASPTIEQLVARVHAFDEAVEKRLEPLRNAPLDRFFYSLSSAADHGLIWGAIGGVRALRRHDPKLLARLSAVMSAESLFTNGFVKSFFRRVRPPDHFQHDERLPYGMRRPISSSFPSGHAVSGFMAATLLADSPAAPLWFGLATAVAATRVYVRMHHASDVVAGAALGVALGAVARKLLPVGGRR
jgi:undecaprenyl-diphosphatase